MELQRDQAVNLLRECGFLNADKKDNDTLVNRLKNLPNVAVEDKDKPQTEENMRLFQELVESVQKGEGITVIGEVTQKAKHGENGATVTKGRRTKKNEDGTPKERKKPGRSRDGQFMRDWGPRDSSEAHAVFHKLGSKTMTAQEWAEAAGVTEKRILAHVKYWKERGAPIKGSGDKGFSLEIA